MPMYHNVKKLFLGLRMKKISNKMVFIPECINTELALKILTAELLGTNYVCCEGVCSPYQANAMVVRDILERYANVEVKILDGRVYGDNK